MRVQRRPDPAQRFADQFGKCVTFQFQHGIVCCSYALRPGPLRSDVERPVTKSVGRTRARFECLRQCGMKAKPAREWHKRKREALAQIYEGIIDMDGPACPVKREH